MVFLKVATLYFIGSVLTVLFTNYIAPQVSWMTSPFQTSEDITFAVICFTVGFSLFDWFVLRKIVKK